MGFFDKIKEKASQIKEVNKNFGSTMRRINNRAAFYGNVNRGIKNGDFFEGSYVNIEDGKGVIYSTAQDDYLFTPDDIKSFNLLGDGEPVAVGDQKALSLRYVIEFKDGKKAQADLIVLKVESFKAAFKLL